MKQMKTVVLVDSEEWVAPLITALDERGLAPRLVNIRTLSWDAETDFTGWGLVVNRVSARPELASGHPTALLRRTQDLLMALEIAGVPCVHGTRAYAVGSSKALQARCFHQLGLATPATRFLMDGDLERSLSGLDTAQWLLKPNPGGFGAAIGTPGSPSASAAFDLDGLAVLQKRIRPSQPLVFRAEFVGRELAYVAASALEDGETNYCLARAGDEVRLSRELAPAIQEACLRILDLADMQLGSVEYLIGDRGEPLFIDVNPVSSPHPGVRQQLGVDIWAMQAELIAATYNRLT